MIEQTFAPFIKTKQNQPKDDASFAYNIACQYDTQF